MTLPKNDFLIKIGPLTFNVKYKHDLGKTADCFGQVNYEDQVIYIDPKYSEDRQKETLLHEIFHVLIDHSGYNLRFNSKKPETYPDAEDWCTTMGIAMYQVIKDNPEVFK